MLCYDQLLEKWCGWKKKFDDGSIFRMATHIQTHKSKHCRDQWINK